MWRVRVLGCWFDVAESDTDDDDDEEEEEDKDIDEDIDEDVCVSAPRRTLCR
jgi:hypothetical protein